jgi:hypothetical protein
MVMMGYSWDGSDWANGALIGLHAKANWTASSHPCKISFEGVSTGATTRNVWGTFDECALILGTDPGGSELLRVGGTVKANERFLQSTVYDAGTASSTLAASFDATVATVSAGQRSRVIRAVDRAFIDFELVAGGRGIWKLGTDFSGRNDVLLVNTGATTVTSNGTVLAYAYTQLGGALGTQAANSRNHFVQYNAGTASAAVGWIAAAFGDTSAPRLVIGQNDSKVTIGAHGGELEGWEHFFLSGTNTKNVGWFVGHSTAVNWQSMAGGQFIGNCNAAPTGNPSGGGYLYVESGALKYRGSSGTVTTVGPA